jgi:sulfatase modifying factor 1
MLLSFISWGCGHRAAAADGFIKDDYSETVKGVSFKMVRVQGGTFTMGCTAEQGEDCLDWETPRHKVTLSDYWIGETEITQALWRAVMGSNPSEFGGCDECPVEMVSWEDVQEFILKLNANTGNRYRLPTEAEWEYAARGGKKNRGYKYSGSNEMGEVAWYGDNSEDGTRAVKSKRANELGLYDMSGNVWEWCMDGMGDYSTQAQMDPLGSGSYRVFRGGCWRRESQYCRVSNRSDGASDFRYHTLGFRLAASQ